MANLFTAFLTGPQGLDWSWHRALVPLTRTGEPAGRRLWVEGLGVELGLDHRRLCGWRSKRQRGQGLISVGPLTRCLRWLKPFA